jgi:hypothetical protein
VENLLEFIRRINAIVTSGKIYKKKELINDFFKFNLIITMLDAFVSPSS